MHFEFLRQLRERQDQTAVIPTIADILLAQFQEEQAVRYNTSSCFLQISSLFQPNSSPSSDGGQPMGPSARSTWTRSPSTRSS